jgi:hypothetical protein
VSPTLIVNPALFVIPFKFFWGYIDLWCCKNCQLQSDFHPNSIIDDNISSQVVDKRR